MKESGKFLIKRTAGLLLIAISLTMFGFYSFAVVSYGALAELAFIWFFSFCILTGSLLIAGVTSKSILRASAIAFAFFLPWSTILFIPLPDQTQFLVAVLILFIGLGLYRSHRSHSSSVGAGAHIGGN